MSGSPNFYAPAHLIRDYDLFCPIVDVAPVIQENGIDAILPYWGEISVPVDKLIKNAGFLVLEIGSVENEHTVQTAAVAVFQSLNALFSACHDIVGYERIRTAVELSEFLKLYRCNFSHIIMIGHGGMEGIHFLDRNSPVRGNELAGLLAADNHDNDIQIVSLCCHSGCAENARALSNGEGVTEVIAPEGAFDLRWSVHFVLGYFLSLFLKGKNLEEAVCDAALDKVATPMKIWRKGHEIYRCAEGD